MRNLFILSMLFASALAWGQFVSAGYTPASAVVNAVILDPAVSPCTATTSITSVTSINCTLSSVPAGDLLFCGTAFGDAGENLEFTDSVNGTWSPVIYQWSNGSYHASVGMWAFANSAAGSPVVTMNISQSRNSEGMICGALKNARTSAFLDGAFPGFFDSNATTSTTPELGSSRTPTNAKELLLSMVSTGNNTTSTAGASFTRLSATDATDHLYMEQWSQSTATASNCPWATSPADTYGTICYGVIPSADAAGVTPYVWFVLNFEGIGTSAPTLATLINSASGGVNGYSGGEVDGDSTLGTFCSANSTPWTLINTHTDLTGTTAGPTSLLNTSLWLPTQQVNYTGNSPDNLQFGTGTAGDMLCHVFQPIPVTLAFGYYVEWNIPNTDSTSHTYEAAGIYATTSTDVVGLELVPNGTNMNIDLASTGNSLSNAGTGTASTVYWVTEQYSAGGTDKLAFYTGCPSACTSAGSTSVTDTVSSVSFVSVFLGSYPNGGTQATGDDIWFRNMKFCSAYPCLP